MANLKKWKRSTMAPIVKEATRQLSKYKRRVDPKRTHLNYALVGGEDYKTVARFVDKKIRDVMGPKIRPQTKSNMRPLGTWIITLPQELKGLPEEEQRRFFEVCTDFVGERYGRENIAYAIVHKDERTPHIHFGVVPVGVSQSTGKMVVSAKAVFTPEDLETYHNDLDAVIAREFGQAGLMLNGRTKGNYTVDELEERDRANAELKAREKAVTEREQRVSEGSRQLQMRATELTFREKDVEKESKAANKANDEAKARMDSVNQSTRELNERIERYNQHVVRLRAKEREQREREDMLNKKEVVLKERETLLESATRALSDFKRKVGEFTQNVRNALEGALNRKSEDDEKKVRSINAKFDEKVIEPTRHIFEGREIDPTTLIDDLKQPIQDANDLVSDLEVYQPSALER